MNFDIHPSLDEFKSLSKDYNLIAISTNINMDLDTPVSIYYKLVDKGRGFILESVDTTHQAFGRYSFIGADPFVRLQVFHNKLMIQEGDLMKCIDGNPVDTINKYISTYKVSQNNKLLPLANGGMVGYFNFEIAAAFDRIRNLQLGDEDLLGQFMICKILVVFDSLKNSAQLIYLADTRNKSNIGEFYTEIVKKINEIRTKLNVPLNLSMANLLPVKPRKSLIDFKAKYDQAPRDFLEAIEKAKSHIFAGDIFQVVPSFQFKEKITKPAFLFYRRLRQVNPSPYMFYFNFGSVKLVGASPEMLVKVSGQTVYTYPIAGTRRRGKDEAEDAVLAAELQADIKECAEHSMLVDLARNDIGRISKPGTVKVPKFRTVEYFSHVMHMVSSVTGDLIDNFTPMEVLKATFPAGTVSGAPKLRAMEIINDLEPTRRGTYAGSVGYIDFCGNLDMCITLRTMRIDNDDTAVIQAGAGIVADSVPINEYREILQKAKALFEVVEKVENYG